MADKETNALIRNLFAKVDVRANLRNDLYTNQDQYPLRLGSQEVKAWQNKARELEQKFKEDLFKEFDLVDHPKRELLFTKSWDYGDHNLEEVYYTFSDLVELIK